MVGNGVGGEERYTERADYPAYNNHVDKQRNYHNQDSEDREVGPRGQRGMDLGVRGREPGERGRDIGQRTKLCKQNSMIEIKQYRYFIINILVFIWVKYCLSLTWREGGGAGVHCLIGVPRPPIIYSCHECERVTP